MYMAITLEISIYILLDDAPWTLAGHVTVPPVPPAICYGAIFDIQISCCGTLVPYQQQIVYFGVL